MPEVVVFATKKSEPPTVPPEFEDVIFVELNSTVPMKVPVTKTSPESVTEIAYPVREFNVEDDEVVAFASKAHCQVPVVSILATKSSPRPWP